MHLYTNSLMTLVDSEAEDKLTIQPISINLN